MTKERPIIFSGPMVRAILAGRKTMTRRVVKPQPVGGVRSSPFVASGLEDGHGRELRCPYGKPGDRLYVREAWRIVGWDWEGPYAVIQYKDGCKECFEPPDEQGERWEDWLMREVDRIAQLPGVTCDETSEDGRLEWEGDDVIPWKPSIHMPRWASRILLEVTDVRVERVQVISAGDAIDEGIENISGVWSWFDGVAPSPADFVTAFSYAWDALNAKRGHSWESNPWVWVVEFRRVEP